MRNRRYPSPHPPATVLNWGGFVRSGWLIVVAWVLIALAALPFAAHVSDDLDAGARLSGSGSANAELALQQQFESPLAKIALLRISGAPAPLTPEGDALLK